MSNVFETLYTALTAILDHLTYCADLVNDGIAFIGSSWDYMTSFIVNLPAAVQGIFILSLALGVLCLILHR